MDKRDFTIAGIKRRLRESASQEDAAILQRFFKTGPGEYGEGDVFIGVRVPAIRKVVREFRGLPIRENKALLRSRIHEERLLALLLLVDRFKRGDERERERVYRLYLEHTQHINNWDLVDLTAPNIVGAFLADRSRQELYELAVSPMLWERRIAILATFHFIRQNDFDDCLRIATILRDDGEDLMHKAVGWMLREVGKRDQPVEERFLRKHYKRMPRTMLRYAIERFEETLRQAYLKGEV